MWERPSGRPEKEDTMEMKDQDKVRKTAKWALGGLGVALAYFGAFALLMYPVIDASKNIA
jgi:hypothetical protein